MVVTTLLDLIFLFLGFNQIDNNAYAMSLARTHREMQTSFFEIGVQYEPLFLRIWSAFPDASSPHNVLIY